jgi:UDP-4-amino-4,6-dideoxy-N-acetyl-beta-L-altrosamine N-acetyltransferase
MIVEQYGVRYERVVQEDLELIRYWRNQPFLRNTMQFRDYITPAMQQQWFNRINNPYNYYMIISYRGKKVGLINCKDTAPDTRIAEGGIFIWERSYWGTPIPVFAALTMLEAVFEVFQTGEASVVTVLKENKRALEFNKLLGYEITGENENGDCYRLFLTKEKFLSRCPRLKRAGKIFSGGDDKIKVYAQPGPLYTPELNAALAKLNSSTGF